MKIMFICTGNICRSAMAQALLEKKVVNLKNKIESYSAGIFAEDNDRASTNSIEVLKQYDIDLTKHRAINIRRSNIQDMDLILCMTTGHKNMIIQMYPELKDKIYTLKEYAKVDGMDINDPWGLSEQVYIKTASQINECIEKIIQNM